MQSSCWCKLSLRFEVRKANRVDQDNGCDVCTLECAPDPRFSHAQRSSRYADDNRAVFYIPNGRAHSKRIRLRSRRYRRKVCGQRPTASRILHAPWGADLRPSLQETFYKWYYFIAGGLKTFCYWSALTLSKPRRRKQSVKWLKSSKPQQFSRRVVVLIYNAII